ncbi:iron-siderophore ABC transporter substrate-binding protein [Actinotalea ferrariae]|uniref:iron-siderophore ABC transporter substrate-binding protein n=1 Tax=Actinotalea ferrariae TaxID=1386098 RepID=UPI001C8B8F48|nr:iron-siderophore ABC transporter substrate-binding protein [Actinotalea ferrariae]MBX9246858.1 iron-siderophore ABC transporter substrate-binding protein [Actinotalea ferrariae]
MSPARPSSRPRPGVRRRATGLVVAAVTAFALAACGGATTDDEPEESESPAAEGDDSAFPVTIEHALGTTTIEAAPERVVTIGWGSQDTALALGTVPVGVPADTWAGDEETGLLPWTAEAVEELGGELPTTFVDLPEVDVEAVAELQPDLILATYSGISPEVYAQLEQLAPTIAYPEQPWLVSWQDQTIINGTALGQAEEAERLVADMEELLARTGSENPSLAGRTFAFVYTDADGTLSAYVEGDPRVDLLTGLGMELAPGVAGLEAPEGTFFVDLGTESMDLLDDADVLITWFNDEEEQATVEALGTFAAIPAVQRGSYLPLLDRQLSMAMSTTTALSLPWGLETFVPQLVEAADKVGTA